MHVSEETKIFLTFSLLLHVIHRQLLSHTCTENVGDKGYIISMSIYAPNEFKCENAALTEEFT